MTDLNEICQRISLFALAEAAGASFEGHGRRSHCPLPRHAGDRSGKSFVIYDNGRRWKCHSSCPSDFSGGDVISFYMAWKDLDFKTALRELTEWTESATPAPPVPGFSTSSVPPPQPLEWHRRAVEFVAYAQNNLHGRALEYLTAERGLSPQTAKAFGLGYNPSALYDDPSLWGLTGKKIWLPRGIVIPGFWKGEVHYIKIRRPLPGDALGEYIGAWGKRDGAQDIKFGGPRGGRSVLFRLEFRDFRPTLLLTEGEWDAMLVWEHGADLCDVGTIGGAGAKFDTLDLALLTRYRNILVLHDDDKAGDRGRAYIQALQAASPRIQQVQPPAHDLTDFWKSGGDLRDWLINLTKETK
jgi:DNA primase